MRQDALVEVEGIIYCTTCAPVGAPSRSLGRRPRRRPRRRARREWRRYEDARAFVRGLGLKNVREWRAFAKGLLRGRTLPEDIPASPDGVYRALGKWTSWGDWLGNGEVGPGLKVWRSFEEAHEFVRRLQLPDYTAWREYSRGDRPDLGPRPDDIPADPARVYADEWQGWADWLGTENEQRGIRREWRPFPEARKFVRSLGLKNQAEWDAWVHGRLPGRGPVPADIPRTPRWAYKGEWVSMGDWLGTGTIAPFRRRFLSFKKARAFARSLGFRTQAQWLAFVAGAPKNGRLPSDVPAAPWIVYPRQWRGIRDWLGSSSRRGSPPSRRRRQVR